MNSDQFIMVYPLVPDAPPPNADMPKEIRGLYEEAMMIQPFSPRGAAAILRLCLQKVCNFLANKEDSIANNLAALGKSDDPIPKRFFTAAHTVRVIGNEAVHPGCIDFSDCNPDNDKTVNDLFVLINSLIENQISQLKMMDSIIERQPEQIKNKILKSQKKDR